MIKILVIYIFLIINNILFIKKFNFFKKNLLSKIFLYKNFKKFIIAKNFFLLDDYFVKKINLINYTNNKLNNYKRINIIKFKWL